MEGNSAPPSDWEGSLMWNPRMAAIVVMHDEGIDFQPLFADTFL